MVRTFIVALMVPEIEFLLGPPEEKRYLLKFAFAYLLKDFEY